jgi:NAD(P) transhydrogenase subunit alpha
MRVPAAVTDAVGVVRESAAGERRVALDPAAVGALTKLGRVVFVERGAGEAARLPDSLYEASGAMLVSRTDVLDKCGVLAVVRPPDAKLIASLRKGHTLIGLLDPLHNLPTVTELAKRGVTVVAFELLPRTVSRAQSMDALSSQASAAGYRAAIVAAESFARYLPMMITASGTATPAKVLVIGTGVAGLQAIATARRLGAVVTGYDVRAASRGEVESLGATFMTSSISEGAGAGGYARAMTPEERAQQQAELEAALKAFDVIITTAKVPGQAPPVLVSKDAVATLRPGTVCVDLGSSELGGNVAGSVPNTSTVTPSGVTIIGAGELASDLPASASQMYGRNVVSVLATLFPQGLLELDPEDEVHKNIVVTHGGEVSNAVVRAALKLDPLPTQEKVVTP